ncbi:hypothetical protein BOTBODRAFT_30777 [Botryobasidium botryosum FD-172 SS1]|uniref:DUF6533 domain-containing protein n=1 Tax=Botryobasidium botryosum (strain FD-172 SS1) TaxID=930990 RepID=A0A067MP04_BOTB1|nr:hypothetical protein BOTBODRAFT_30777 [Botryobasidium botryosum FD-172 SS1]
MSLHPAVRSLETLGDPYGTIYITVAAVTFLIYDHALTFEQEIRLVWRAPWNFAKTVFLFIRYYSPLSTLLIIFIPLQGSLSNLDSCKVVTALISISITLCHASADLLLLIRVYAIWKQSRKVLVAMCALWAVSYVAIALADATLLAHVNEELRVTHTCFNYQIPSDLYFGWASSLLFDTCAFGLTVVKAFEHWKSNQIHAPLLRVFYIDGAGYYFVLTILRAFTFAGSVTENVILFTIATHLARSLTVILTTRMFLNLRSVRTHEDWATATNLIRPAWPRRRSGDCEASVHDREEDWQTRTAFDSCDGAMSKVSTRAL